MDETLEVSVTVTNVGDGASEEVVKVFTHDRVGSRSRPSKELAGFERVSLSPDESTTVTLTVDSDDLSFWTIEEEVAAEPGEFDVMIGRAADDIRDSESFELVG
jgi:beta-glucosidase